MKIKLIAVLFFPIMFAGSLLRAESPAKQNVSYEHYLHGLLLDKQGNIAKARDEYEKAVEGAPSSALLHKTLADVSLRMGRVDEAVEEIEKAIALNPSDHDTRILAGEIYFNKGNSAAARQNLEKALAINPQSEDALLNLAYLSTEKEPRQAVEYYKKYLDLHPDSPQVNERLALLYQQLGENNKAEASWQEVLGHSEDSVKADLSLGQIYEVKGDTQTSLGYYEKARITNPHNVPLLIHLGQIYFKLNRSTDAAAAFQQAIALAPDSLVGHFWLAMISESRRDWKEAAAHMERVSRSLPEPGILLRLSYYDAQAGDMAASLEVLDQLRNLDPSNPEYIYYQAIGEETAGRLKEAAGLLDQFLALRPRDAAAHFELATVLDRLGHFDDAVLHLQKAIELKPDYDVAINYLGYSWADRGIHLQDAEALIKRAVSIDPSDAAYRDSLGWVYYQEGRYAEAAAELEKAANPSHDSTIEEHWGDALIKLGKKTGAYQAWEEAASTGEPSRALKKKIRSVRDDVPADVRARLALQRAEETWASLKNFSASARVTLQKPGSPEARSLVQIDYKKGGVLKVEPVAPGAAGFVSWEDGKWTNTLVGTQGLDDSFQNIAVKVESFLSGRLLDAFLKDSSSVTGATDDEGHYASGGLQMTVSIEDARVERIQWGDGKGVLLEIEYHNKDIPDFPSRISYTDTDPISGASARIDFNRVLINEPDKPQ